MIESIELKNFKNIKKAKINIRPVTVLIGPNGSGKSNIIQSLMLLKQSMHTSKLVMTGKYYDFISIKDISFYKNENLSIFFRYSGLIDSAKLELLPEMPAGFSFLVDYRVTNFFRFEHLDSQLIELQTTTQDDDFALDYDREHDLSFDNEISVEIFDMLFRIKNLRNVGVFLNVISPDTDPDILPEKFVKETIIKKSIESMGKDLEKLFFIPASRGILFSSVNLSDEPSKEFTSFQESYQQSQEVLSTLVYDPEIADKISVWIQKITGIPIRSRLLPKKKVTVESKDNIYVNIIHEGFGLNQLIQLLATFAIVPSESLITIEEPESHLHPRAQAELIKVILENIKKKSLKTIITTHSEHVLFAFLTQVANRTLKNSDIAIYYFEKTDNGSKISPLEITPQGTIEGGLPGFFEANLSVYKAYIDAITQDLELESE